MASNDRKIVSIEDTLGGVIVGDTKMEIEELRAISDEFAQYDIDSDEWMQKEKEIRARLGEEKWAAFVTWQKEVVVPNGMCDLCGGRNGCANQDVKVLLMRTMLGENRVTVPASSNLITIPVLDDSPAPTDSDLN